MSQTQQPSNNTKVGFIGAGKMGGALIEGIIESGLLSPADVTAYDPDAARLADLAARLGFEPAADNLRVAERSTVVVLAVKPQEIGPAAAEIGAAVGGDRVVASIAAGITIAALEQALGGSPRVIRVMPNTPCLVRAGMMAVSAGRYARPGDLDEVSRILSPLGRVVTVPEKYMDAVTGLSGSGPAYVYTVIEALADGGVKVGLPRDLALLLAAQTVLGSAELVLDSGLHPAQLRDMVTSPGGTTIHGMSVLESGGLRAALMGAVEAATKRSQELGSK